MKIKTHRDLEKDFDDIPISKFWSVSEKTFSKKHNIHVYPAKFPPFLVDKALRFAQKRLLNAKVVADVFCGCGTTALESLMNEKDFWGIDCNPVATLITRVKTSHYNGNILDKYFNRIVASYENRKKRNVPKRLLTDERIRFWYREEEIANLNSLLLRIKNVVPKGKYQDFFLCALSNILKKTSLWLQKSIKPTKDYEKEPHDVLKAFTVQFNMMKRAFAGSSHQFNSHNAIIKTGNILKFRGKSPKADLLVTSPPYVTSYEYADLHQLSSIWLNYAKDYRDLRKGSIGSTYGLATDYINNLNIIGREIVSNLSQQGTTKQAKAVSKYFYDMKNVLGRINEVIRPGGMGVIVIGNTEYSGVKIDNAKYLAYELFSQKMQNITIYKREIGTKILTRYRDEGGKFTNKMKSKNVYHCEFLITFQTPE